MGGFLLTLFAVVCLSAWTACKEDELDAELSRNYCKNCGAEMLSSDKFCVVCGAVNDKYVAGDAGSEPQSDDFCEDVSQMADDDAVEP